MKKIPKSSRKQIVFPVTETKRRISVHKKSITGTPEVNHDEYEECDPPPITVNPSQANVSALSLIWADSGIEGITPLAGASVGSPSTSSVMAPQVASLGSSSSATTSLIQQIPVRPILDPGDLSELMESAKKAFKKQN